MNAEIKKIVDRVKTAQDQLQKVLNNQDWMDEVRKYAERQGQEVRKLIDSDMGKVKSFVERERKELEKFQKQLPGEVKRFKTLITKQRKELEKLLRTAGKAAPARPTAKKKPARVKTKTTGGKKKTTASSHA